MAEPVERRPRVREIRSSVADRVKPMTFKIDICLFIAWHLELTGLWTGQLSVRTDNLTEWDVISGHSGHWPDFQAGKHHMISMCVSKLP